MLAWGTDPLVLRAFGVLLALSFAVALVGTSIVLRIAQRHALIDVPNERSSHSIPTPRSGGIGIVAGVLAALALVLPEFPYSWLVAALVCAGGVGLCDDVRTLAPRVKMFGLLAAAVLAAQLQLVDTVGGVPFARDVALAWAAWPLTLFWLACYPSAFNFMDGIDGIATVTAIVSGAAFSTAGALRHDSVLCLAGAVAASASLGFLPWNFPRARIFMGDAGSLPLGLMLAWCAVRANATGALSFPASVLLLGPFLFDVTFTLVRRGIGGRTIGAPHREHLYQRLSRVWGSHVRVSLLYAGFSCVTGCLALCYGGLTELGKLLSLTLPLLAMLGFAALVLRAERVKGS